MSELITEDDGRDVADYVVAASRPVYERAFAKAMKGRQVLWSDEEKQAVIELDRTTIRQESRAALSTVGANGGFMIPFFLDPTIILTNAGTTNPFREISRVEQIPTNVWHGVSSAGVTAEWTSEASEGTDASPTFTQPTVIPVRGDAYIQVSLELISDSRLTTEIGMLFADAKARLEATAFAVGTGSTQPLGIVTRLQQVTASRVNATTNGQFGQPDLFALVNNLPARWQSKFGGATAVSPPPTSTGPVR